MADTKEPTIEEVFATPKYEPKPIRENPEKWTPASEMSEQETGIPLNPEYQPQEMLQSPETWQIDPEDEKLLWLKEYEPNRVDALGFALSNDNLMGTGLNFLKSQWDAAQFQEDPTFDIRQHKGYFGNVLPEFWDELGDAKSEEHLKFLSRKYEKMSMDAQYLDSLGVEGIGYRMAALLGDVPFISALQKANAAGKFGSMIGALDRSYAGRAILAGTAEGTFEGVKQAVSPEDRDEVDMLLAVGVGGLVGGLYRPNVFSQDLVEKTNRYIGDQLTAMSQAGKVQGSVPESIANFVRENQFNVTSQFQKSPSATMRNMGDGLFHDILNPSLGSFKAVEYQIDVIDGVKSMFNENYYPVMKEYMETMYGKGAFSSRFDIGKQEEFYNIAGRLHYGDDALRNSLPPELVKKIEAANAKMSRDSYDVLYKAEHSLFRDGSIQQVDDYLPRRWNTNKLADDLAAGKFTKADFRKAVANGFENAFKKAGLAVDGTRITEASKKFTTSLTKKQINIGEKGYIMQDNTLKSVLQEVQETMGLSADEIAAVEDAFLQKTKGAQKGTARSTRRRTDIDLDGYFTNKNGTTVALKDYLDTNVQTLWNSYGRSMGGDTALRKLGIDSRPKLQKTRDKVVKELSDASGKMIPENQRYLANFDTVVGEMLGIATKTDAEGTVWKATRLLNNLTRSAKLGATWFALGAEITQTAHRVGVKNMLKSIPALKKMRNAFLSGDASQADRVRREMNAYESLGHELQDMPSSARWEDLMVGGGTTKGAKWLNKAEEFSDKAAEFTYMLGGVKSGTAGIEKMFTVANRFKMMEMANGTKKIDYRYLRHFGFDQKLADDIMDQIRKHADFSDKAPLLNLDKWDGNLAHQFQLGTRRQSHTLIQKGNIGDQVGAWTQGNNIGKDTVLGALAMNLRNYMLIAYNKQLSRGIVQATQGGREFMDVFGNWTAQTAVMAGIYMTKTYLSHYDDRDKLQKYLTPERIAAGSFGMTTFASLLPSAIDTAARPITGEGIFRAGARGNDAAILGASVGYALDVGQAVNTVGGLISPYNDVSKYELQKTLGLLPISNALGVKQLTNELANVLAEK